MEGQVITFDDTFIHSVTHNGDQPRSWASPGGSDVCVCVCNTLLLRA